MDELFLRLKRLPAISAELLGATALVNLLALADTVYVMIVLRRYIAHGFDGTLFILTAGVLACIALQWGVRRARDVLAAGVGREPDAQLAADVHRALVTARAAPLESLRAESSRGVVADLQDVQAAFDASNLVALMEGPFAVVYLVAAYFLSPLLALLMLVGLVLSLGSGLLSVRVARRGSGELAAASEGQRSFVAAASRGADTVRVFGGGEAQRGRWGEHVGRLSGLRRAVEDAQGLSQSLSMGLGVFVRVGVYALGAKLAVEGHLTTAALIGASMLASYAMQKATGFSQGLALLTRGAEARSRLEQLLELPREQGGGVAPEVCEGRIRLRGVAFAHEGGEPLFSGLDLDLEPGSVLVVQGYNGSGKTTLLRLLAGLVRPTEGEIVVGGSSLDRLDMAWWRRQLMYMPQEPFFLAGTIRENVAMLRPDADPGELRRILGRCGLDGFLDLSEKGVETPLVDAGRTLPVGTRKRLALARALAGGGCVALLDEPTEGLDAEGRALVYRAMNDMAREGRTIVVVSHDDKIIKGARAVLDLSAKPVPTLERAAAGEER